MNTHSASPTSMANRAAAVPVPDQTSVSGPAHPASVTKRRISDPVLPVNDGGTVRLGTSRLPDGEFLNTVSAENKAVTDNPFFPDPSPSVDEMGGAIGDFQQKVIKVATLKALLKSATHDKDTSRSKVEGLYKKRATYVQLMSNGNTALILKAGFSTRAEWTPTGILQPPMNLIIELGSTPGLMLLTWAPVKDARSYLIEFSPADTMERVWSPLKTSGRAKLRINGLTLGQVYAFRIAAVGGSAGQGDWSAEVIRMAA